MKQESQNCQNNPRLIRSYGRIKSRKLSNHKNSLLENSLKNYEISVKNLNEFFSEAKSDTKNHKKLGQLAKDGLDANADQPKAKSDAKNYKNSDQFFEDGLNRNGDQPKSDAKNYKNLKQFNKFSFEIGFGFGDFLFAKAKSNPNQMFLGCEPHLNGVVNVLAKLEEQPLSNLQVSRQDARELLTQFDDNFFDEIYILFPDPWPKIKHFKRRLINLEFLDNILAKKLKSGGKLIIATDHASYKTWILSAILKSQNFIWNAASKQDWQVFPDDWIITKYQKKAAREGRVSVIFNLIKL